MKKIIFSIAGISALVLAFQNCAPGFDSEFDMSNKTNSPSKSESYADSNHGGGGVSTQANPPSSSNNDSNSSGWQPVPPYTNGGPAPAGGSNGSQPTTTPPASGSTPNWQPLSGGQRIELQSGSTEYEIGGSYSSNLRYLYHEIRPKKEIYKSMSSAENSTGRSGQRITIWISESPGGPAFSTRCLSSSTNPTIRWSNGTSLGYCQLSSSKTYYFNVSDNTPEGLMNGNSGQCRDTSRACRIYLTSHLK